MLLELLLWVGWLVGWLVWLSFTIRLSIENLKAKLINVISLPTLYSSLLTCPGYLAEPQDIFILYNSMVTFSQNQGPKYMKNMMRDILPNQYMLRSTQRTSACSSVIPHAERCYQVAFSEVHQISKHKRVRTPAATETHPDVFLMPPPINITSGFGDLTFRCHIHPPQWQPKDDYWKVKTSFILQNGW